MRFSQKLSMALATTLSLAIVTLGGVRPASASPGNLINPAFERLFRLTAAATLGQQVLDLARGEWNFPELQDPLEALMLTGQPFEGVEVERVFPAIGVRQLKIYLVCGSFLSFVSIHNRIYGAL